MAAPPFEIRLPPGFEVVEEPSELGRGRAALFAVSIEDDRGRRGVMLARQTRQDVVRSLVVYEDELGPLSDFLHARRAH